MYLCGMHKTNTGVLIDQIGCVYARNLPLSKEMAITLWSRDIGQFCAELREFTWLQQNKYSGCLEKSG